MSNLTREWTSGFAVAETWAHADHPGARGSVQAELVQAGLEAIVQLAGPNRRQVERLNVQNLRHDANPWLLLPSFGAMTVN